MACLWLGTQSKGGGVALAVSAIVVFAVSGRRLRLLVPTAVVAVLGAFAAEPLTEPFRTDGQAFDDAVRHAGTVTLVLAGIGALAGLAYALVDRRLRVPDAARIWAGRIVLGLVCAALSRASSASSRPSTIPYARRRTGGTSSRSIDRDASASSHFGALGSNRYDFWRRRLGRVRASPARRHRRVRLGERVPRPRREPRDTPIAPTRSSSTRSRRPASSASCSWSGRGRRSCSALPAAREARSWRPAPSGRRRTSRSTREATGCGRSPPSGCRCSSSPASRCRRTTRRRCPAASRFPPASSQCSSPSSRSRRRGSRPASSSGRTTRRRLRRLATLSAGPDGSIRCPSTRISRRRRSSTRRRTSRRCVAPSRRSRETRTCDSCSASHCWTPAARRTPAASFESRWRSRRATRRFGTRSTRAR